MITLLIGHRGVGKTSLLRRLEVLFQNSDVVLRDLDSEIEARRQNTIEEIFKTQGEAQTFYNNAGGVQYDTNRLDGNKDGEACESLPKGGGN
jgi:energy-coupling factor transporter ATP-binding protein EcfA2